MAEQPKYDLVRALAERARASGAKPLRMAGSDYELPPIIGEHKFYGADFASGPDTTAYHTLVMGEDGLEVRRIRREQVLQGAKRLQPIEYRYHYSATKPMRAATWEALRSHWSHLRLTGQDMGWGKPLTELDLRLDGYYIRVLRFTPKGRHVHYKVLGEKPKKREDGKKPKSTRRWMRTKQFLQAATVCGHYVRVGEELVWIEPMESAPQ